MKLCLSLVFGIFIVGSVYAGEKGVNLPVGQTCETWQESVRFENNFNEPLKFSIATKENAYAESSVFSIPAQDKKQDQVQIMKYSYTFLDKESGYVSGFVSKGGSPFCYLSFHCKKVGKEQYQSTVIARGKECILMTVNKSNIVYFGGDNPSVPS